MQLKAVLQRLICMLFSRKYTLSVKTPCHESWENMHPASKGKFCDACTKNVIDFSVMTEKEIAAYFRQRPANVCGRFRSDQLQKDYVSRPQLKIPFHKRFFSYLISFFVSNAVINKVAAQADTTSISVTQPDTLVEMVMGDTIISDSLVITEADTGLAVPAGISLTVPECHTDTFYILETMVMGFTTSAPVKETPIADFFADTAKYIKAAVSIKKTEIPFPDKEPVKQKQEELSAVLPEEIRRKFYH